MKCCLTIAGSDSGGNAGVQADLRAFHAYGLHGCTVFTALTAQNPFGVSSIHSVPAEFVAAQLDAVLGVYDIAALKTGMLADVKVIEVIAERLKAHPEIKKVIDPVMIATSGAKLVSDEAMAAAEELLFPQATLLTPNIPEAEALLEGGSLGGTAAEDGSRYDTSPRTAVRPRPRPLQSHDLAQALQAKFGCAVLVKGGHATEGGEAVDVLCSPAHGRGPKVEPQIVEFPLPWVANPVSTHGTGCTLAASLAAELALGRDLASAVRGAKATVHSAISRSFWVGANCGVLGFPQLTQSTPF